MNNLRRKTITGYCNPLSVRSGERVDFKVCCYDVGTYKADMVRLIGGDDSEGGIGVIEEVLDAPFANDYPCRHQVIRRGSYGQVEIKGGLRDLTGITLQAMIYPTLPGRQRQVIMGQRGGFTLYLDEDGALAAAIDGQQLTSTGRPVRRHQWLFVGAAYDGETGLLHLNQWPLAVSPGDRANSPKFSCEEFIRKGTAIASSDAPFLFASGGDTNFFNGKIDRPRLAKRALSSVEMDQLCAYDIPQSLADDVLGAWDFGSDISSDLISDRSNNDLRGALFNLPTRGVTGHNWDGGEHNWQHAAEQYGAVHFHQDDLYDVGWETDFSFTIPDDLPSGIYAARLRHGEDWDRIPFFVVPPKGRAASEVAFLVPTASYMAYANTRQRLQPNLIFGEGRPETVNDAFLASHPEVGGSLYDLHEDRSGIHYSSRLRPVMNMKPGDNRPWGLPTDLNIVAWLNNINQEFDVITDEELHSEGAALLQPYRCVMTGSHPEYHSTAMLDGISSFLDQGGRFMYLGGNGFYWRIGFHDDKPGVIEVRRAEDGTRAWMSPVGEYYQSFNGEYGGLWRRNGRPPNRLVGIGFAAQGFERSAFYERQAGAEDPRAAFALVGVGDGPIGNFGSIGDGAAGEEIDRWDTRDGTPVHALVLARASDFGNDMLRTKEDFLSTMPPFNDPNVRADMVFFECPSGGAVFSTGSIAWVSSLAHNGYDNNVAQITGNVLRRFLDVEPFPPPP